jgi:hypothetical protein
MNDAHLSGKPHGITMNLLRHFSTRLALIAATLVALAAPVHASTAATIRLTADRIAFYYDRFLVEADGNVRISTDDGLTITGQTLTMDLKANRFMVAGGVQLSAPSGSQNGAAAADFLDFNRVYFIPITSEPDRWTFLEGDYAHPAKGREMPGDTFAFPDVSQNLPYLYAKSAVIGTRNFVRFQSVTLMVGRIKAAPAPSYYINFSADQHLAENSLSGATYDATWQIAGNANSISAIHFRYDPTNKTYASFEQHIASKNAYAVFSLNPGTQPSKLYNLVTDYEPTPRFEIHSFTQFHTLQNGFTTPAQAQHVTNIQVTAALKNASLQLAYQTVNYCLLAIHGIDDFCGSGPSVVGLPLSHSHPQTWTLGLSSFDFPKGATAPIKLRYRAGIGFIHDAEPLQTLGGAPYQTIWNHYVGLTAYASSLKFGNREDSRKTYFLNLSLDGQRQWYSVPHHIDTIDGIGSLSRVFNRSFAAYTSYEVRQIADYYNEGQLNAYPSPVCGINDTSPFCNSGGRSYSAFHGLATLRTLSVGMAYTPNPDFAFTLLARKHKDFPVPVPGLFPTPPLNVLGEYISPYFLGQAPYDVTGDVRVRVLHHYYLDVQRTYYFNFGTLRWSPIFVIQVTQ